MVSCSVYCICCGVFRLCSCSTWMFVVHVLFAVNDDERRTSIYQWWYQFFWGSQLQHLKWTTIPTMPLLCLMGIPNHRCGVQITAQNTLMTFKTYRHLLYVYEVILQCQMGLSDLAENPRKWKLQSLNVVKSVWCFIIFSKTPGGVLRYISDGEVRMRPNC